MRLQLLTEDLPAGELFSLLRKEVGCPLQAMAGPSDPVVPVLLAGGFRCRRRCYEMEVHRTGLTGPMEERVPLTACSRGMEAYDACRRKLYHYYRETHEAVSPLTAGEAEFFARLPESALCQIENGKVLHFAFVEDGEIAYAGTVETRSFPSFAQSLLARQFRTHDTLCFECDDCDPAAMMLKAFFHTEEKGVVDTYNFD